MPKHFVLQGFIHRQQLLCSIDFKKNKNLDQLKNFLQIKHLRMMTGKKNPDTNDFVPGFLSYRIW